MRERFGREAPSTLIGSLVTTRRTRRERIPNFNILRLAPRRRKLGETRTATLVVEEKYLNFDQSGAYATAFLLAMVSVACIIVVSVIRKDPTD